MNALALSERQKVLAFTGILTVLFLASLNMTVVGSAMPRVISDLGGFHLYVWAFTAYSLATTITIPIVGTVSDRFGRRPLLLLGIAVFTLGSVALGMVHSMEALIFWRAVQGIGGGTLMAMSFTAIADIFTPIERGRYQGYTGAVWGISSVVGPLVGGFLTDHAGWRSVFFVNLPFALLAAYFIWRFFRLPAPGARGAFDTLGAALLGGAVSTLTLAMSWGGGTYAWNSPRILALLAATLGLGAWYVAHSLRQTRPILDLRLLRDRTVANASLTGFLVSAGMFAAILYLPLYMQGVRGLSASVSGLALAPLMGGMIVTSTLSGQRVSRTGRYKRLIVVGALVATGALLLASTLTLNTPLWAAVGIMVLLGLGLGPVNSQLTLAVQNAVPREQLGSATGGNQFFRQIGGTLAVSLFGALVNARLAANLRAELPSEAQVLPAALQGAIANPNILTSPQAQAALGAALGQQGHPELLGEILTALRTVVSGAIDQVFLVSALLVGAAFLLSLALPERPLGGHHPQAQPSEREAVAAD
ncbi:drug resistance transporter, EmrB/QacA subfamily [Deinococcus reticulitermitis]|uniref:Drug resistance transporter, EmrB/QacA subfamily n=1 Tax=Deinococcus reticulitermitis TaxID=856736 RepID=A0A1H7BQ10_9DEIO|nr:MDR family MFS transporter [Deinococcus reticulitermitis]SEJ78407.1 drug resistance transporter, EmrB/QacA subfamily [Deinococcus reticulitermitis]